MEQESKDIKTGLVLEGGAMRGMFTAGVLDVLLENNITVDGTIGVSAGATFGCNYKSRQIGRTIRYNTRFAGDKRYCSIHSLLTTGNLYNADFCYNQIPNILDVYDLDTYRKNPMKFYVVASDCDRGEAVYKELVTCDAKDLTWMRASASMPLASKVVEVDGYHLLDGGMTDSIPIKKFEEMGYNKNIVILTQPRSYEKEENKLIPLMKIALHKYPKLIEAMKKRHIVYNEEKKYVFEKADRGEMIVICPKESLGISRTEKDVNELNRVYEEGRIIAHEKLAQIKYFLNQ